MPPISSRLTGDDIVLGLAEISDCESAASVGDAVYMDGSIAKRGIATSLRTSLIVGIIEKKYTATSCLVRLGGVSSEIYTGLDDSEQYFLSATVPGEITTVAPSGPGEISVVVGLAWDTDRLVVQIGNSAQEDSGPDNFSYKRIPLTETIIISDAQQMIVVASSIPIDGSLVIEGDGELFLLEVS